MIITKTLTLVAAPVPPFIGTKVMLNATADSLVWGIDTADPAEEFSDTVRIEWGDGEVYIGPNEIGNLTHTYPGPGVYEVKISDDILNMDFSGRATSMYLTKYVKLITALESNARNVDALTSSFLCAATNLTRFDMRDVPALVATYSCMEGCTALTSLAGLPRSLVQIRQRAFANCTAATGRVDLPNVRVIGSGSDGADRAPFLNCAGISEIHFAAANEAAVKASPAYLADPHLGAANATLYFDL